MARPKKLVESVKKQKNAWLVIHLVHDKVFKTVIRCDGFDVQGDDGKEVWMMEDDDVVAVIRNYFILEKITLSEADFLEEEQCEDNCRDTDTTKKNLNQMF